MMRQNNGRHQNLFFKIFEKNYKYSLSMHLNVVYIFDTKNRLHKMDPKHPFRFRTLIELVAADPLYPKLTVLYLIEKDKKVQNRSRNNGSDSANP